MDKQVEELFELTVKLKEFPEFQEAKAKEIYEIAIELMKIQQMKAIEKQLGFIEISLDYIE